MAAVSNHSIYTSTDSGQNWTSNSAPDLFWWSVASSADGAKMTAVVNGGPIYTWHTAPSPRLDLIPAGNKLSLSWLTPSEYFVLQQNDNLTTTNWVTLTNTPNLNLTNLRYQLLLIASNSGGFYRLVH
jgi:hypothetical protein